MPQDPEKVNRADAMLLRGLALARVNQPFDPPGHYDDEPPTEDCRCLWCREGLAADLEAMARSSISRSSSDGTQQSPAILEISEGLEPETPEKWLEGRAREPRDLENRRPVTQFEQTPSFQGSNEHETLENKGVDQFEQGGTSDLDDSVYNFDAERQVYSATPDGDDVLASQESSLASPCVASDPPYAPGDNPADYASPDPTAYTPWEDFELGQPFEPTEQDEKDFAEWKERCAAERYLSRPELGLREQIQHAQMFFCDLNTPVGDLIAEAIGDLSLKVSWTRAETVEEYTGRIEILLSDRV